VVNARGTVSPRGGGRDWSSEQHDRLALEGVEFDAMGRLDLARYEWDYGG
jgi:alkylated DNA nucleotide flippase Atl1